MTYSRQLKAESSFFTPNQRLSILDLVNLYSRFFKLRSVLFLFSTLSVHCYFSVLSDLFGHVIPFIIVDLRNQLNTCARFQRHYFYSAENFSSKNLFPKTHP